MEHFLKHHEKTKDGPLYEADFGVMVLLHDMVHPLRFASYNASVILCVLVVLRQIFNTDVCNNVCNILWCNAKQQRM